MSSQGGIQKLLSPGTRHILYRILAEASSSKHFFDATFYHVCKGWCELLDEKLIAEDALSHPENEHSYFDIQTINQKLLHSCFFYGLEDAILPAALQYADLLKRATILKPISNGNFLKLIPMIKNVKSLTLDQQALHGLKKTSLDCLQELKELELFIITGDHMTVRDRDTLLSDWNHNTNVLRRLLEVIDSKNLLQLGVKGYVMPHSNHDGFILETFLDTVIKYRQTLKHITFETRVIEHKTIDHDAIKKKELYLPDFDIKSLDGLKLNSLFFGGQFSCQMAETQEIFKQIFEIQAPKELRYACCDFSKIENPISKKKRGSKRASNPYFNKSLVVLELMLDGDPDALIDCQALFGDCQQLRVLTLSAGEKPETPKSVGPQLFNIAKLPTSLEFFRIRRLNISQEDGNFIMCSLKRLRLLELLDIGTENGLGLPFSAYIESLKACRIEHIIFYHAFNKKSMEEWAHNEQGTDDSPNPPYHKTLDAHEEKHACVSLKLQKSSNRYELTGSEKIASYFPLEKQNVGAYRTRAAPDSGALEEAQPDWVNNPYLKNALSFSRSLVCIASIAESEAESESSESEGSESGDSSWESESEFEVDEDQPQPGSGNDGSESDEGSDETEGELRDDEGEEMITPSQSEMELDEEIEALEDFALQTFEEMGLDEAEIDADKYEECVVAMLDGLADRFGADAEERDGAYACAGESGSAAVLDDDSSDKDEEIIKARGAIQMLDDGDFFALRAEVKAKKAEAKATAQEKAEAMDNVLEPEPESESDSDGPESDMEADANSAGDHEGEEMEGSGDNSDN